MHNLRQNVSQNLSVKVFYASFWRCTIIASKHGLGKEYFKQSLQLQREQKISGLTFLTNISHVLKMSDDLFIVHCEFEINEVNFHLPKFLTTFF